MHELGHAFADWVYGIPVSNIDVILHPFLPPGTGISGIFPDNLAGFTYAAGPLANIVIGLLVFIVLWRKRSAYLLPFLMWGPIACVQEGMNLAANVTQAGTDSAQIIASG